MSPSARAVELAPVDYEARVVDFARRVLDDVPECASAEFKVRWMDSVPTLWVAFCAPGEVEVSTAFPACVVRLKTISISNPISGGQLLEIGDRLRGHVRRSLENYMLKHGIRVLPFDPELAAFALKRG